MALTVSVVTPAYNHAQFIERTICSVLEQGIPVEFAIFDNLSKDGTIEILKKYDDRIHWVSEKDRGQAHAVNKGIDATHGEIIGWINSDDIYYPGAFQTMLAYFEAHPEVDLVYGDGNHIGLADEILEPYPTEDWNFERLKDVCYICQPAAFFRRRVVAQVGHLEESLHYNMDYDYWLRIGMGGLKAARLPALFAGSRMYQENKTLANRAKKHAEINEMFIRLMGRVPERWLYNYAHAYLDERGFPRTARFRFATAVSALSIWSAFKWNHRVTRTMLTTCRHWISASVK